MKKYKTIRLADIILACAVALTALLLIFFQSTKGSDNVVAEITYNGQLVQTVNLSEVTEPYTLKYAGTEISVEKGAISFFSSDCPSQDCVRSGKLTHSGDTAACIPNRVMISLSSDREKQYQTY